MISDAMRRARSRREPLEVILTLTFNFGDSPDDAVTVVKDRRVPLVGSVFDNRDRIAREFLRLITRTAARQPRLLRRFLGGRDR